MSGRGAPFLMPMPTPAGASSCSASLTPFEARILISAARIEAVVMRAAMPMTAMKSVLTLIGSPSDFKQIAPDDDSAAVVLAHAFHPHVVGDRVVVLWDEVRQDEQLHSRRGRDLAD